jgi:uncharacterized protein (TIGR01777 family)
MRIVISGASGLIGTALRASLGGAGHQVVVLVRRPVAGGADEVAWDPAGGKIDAAGLEGADAIVNLSGRNLAEGRWTEARKKDFGDSRIASTELLGPTLAGLRRPPGVFVSASAIGLYGDRGDEVLSESSSRGSGFLPDLCEKWESAADAARAAGIRVVHPRIGVVLSLRGGALKKMLLPFKLGLGGVIGSGRQYMSWIALSDLIRIIETAITQPTISGPVNAVAPSPVTNRQFTKALGRVLRRPTVLPMPAPLVKLLLGEMGRTFLLEGARVVPKKLTDCGYQFAHPSLEQALRAELGM